MTDQKQREKRWAPSFVWAIREKKTGLWNKKGWKGLVGRTGVVYRAKNHATCHITGTVKTELDREVLTRGLCENGRGCKRCERNARRRFARRFELVRFQVQENPEKSAQAKSVSRGQENVP